MYNRTRELGLLGVIAVILFAYLDANYLRSDKAFRKLHNARNHAAFWDGKALELTPAYDLCPQIRSGETYSQAMAFDRKGTRDSSFAAVVAAAPVYGLTTTEARAVVDAPSRGYRTQLRRGC